MRTKIQSIIGMSTIAVLAIGAMVRADEQKISIDAAPPAVKAAITKLLGTNKLETLSKETEDGKTTYEAEYDVDDVDHSATISETGDVLEEEVDIKLTDLPAAVKDAVAKAEPKGTLKEAVKVTAQGKTSFEVEVTVDKDVHEIKLSPEGVVASNKIEKPESEKGDKD